ncbi:hypothetical protein BST61_g1750 [Cercospora zeina]
MNAIFQELIKHELPLEAIKCAFHAPKCNPPNTSSGESPDGYPLDVPANQVIGLQALLSSLRCLEISLGSTNRSTSEGVWDETRGSCWALVKHLPARTVIPELALSGGNHIELKSALKSLEALRVHRLTLKGMKMEGSDQTKLFLKRMKGSLRNLTLSRVGCHARNGGWKSVLPWMGQNLTLESIKLDGVFNFQSSYSTAAQPDHASKPYSYENSGGPEEISARLLRDSGHDWEVL